MDVGQPLPQCCCCSWHVIPDYYIESFEFGRKKKITKRKKGGIRQRKTHKPQHQQNNRRLRRLYFLSPSLVRFRLHTHTPTHRRHVERFFLVLFNDTFNFLSSTGRWIQTVLIAIYSTINCTTTTTTTSQKIQFNSSDSVHFRLAIGKKQQVDKFPCRKRSRN